MHIKALLPLALAAFLAALPARAETPAPMT